MKKKIIKTLTMILIGMTVFSEGVTAFGATLNSCSGSVYVRKGGGKNKTKAFTGMYLANGDILCTGFWSSATVTIDSGKTVKVGSNSNIYVKNINTVSQTKGSSVTSGKSTSYNHQTPTAIMGIKGTTFAVELSEDSTFLALPEGNIEVKPNNGNSFSLVSGQQVNVGGTASQTAGTLQTVEVKEINPAELNEFTGNALIELKDNFAPEIANKIESSKNNFKKEAEPVQTQNVSVNDLISFNNSGSSASSTKKKSSSSLGSSNSSLNSAKSEYFSILPEYKEPTIMIKPKTDNGIELSGKKIDFTFNNECGQNVKGINVVTNSGKPVASNGTSFIMPNENVIVTFLVESPQKVKIIY